jgi:hypothetical protein
VLEAIASDCLVIVKKQDIMKLDGCELDGIELVGSDVQATMMNDFRELSSV